MSQRISQQNDENGSFAREHRNARAMHAEIQAEAERSQQRCAERRTDERGGHIRERFALRAQ